MINVYKNLPTLDLHGEYGDVSRVLIDDFIKDCLRMKKYKLIIIHGVGQKILQKVTKDTLSKNKYVEDFKLDNFNSGQTIVLLKKQ